MKLSFPEADFMAWAKSLNHDIEYDLFSSGVPLLMEESELIFGESFIKISGEHTNAYGYPPLRELLAERQGVTPDQVAVTQGSSHANYLIAAAIFEEPGGQALVELPCYQPMMGAVQGARAEIIRFKRKFQDRYQLDLDLIKDLCTSNTRLIVITRLHNPSGVDIPVDTLRELNDLAAEYNAWVLVDEVFLDFMDYAQPAASIGDRMITTNSMTKVYGLGDLRFGWGVGNADIIKRAQEINDYICVLNPFIAEYLGYRILSSQPIMDTMRQRIKDRVTDNFWYFKEWASTIPDMEWVPPDGGTICFPKVGSGDVGDRLYRLLLDKHKTIITPGSLFDCPEHVRIGLSAELKDLKEGLRRFREAFLELRKSSGSQGS